MPPRRAGLKVISRKGTTTLYLRGTVRGLRIFESAGTDDPDLAEEARAAREAELYRAAVHGTRPRVTFAAAALDYLRHEQRSVATKLAINKLLKHFGPATACDEIDQARIDRAARSICRSTASPATKLRQVVGPTKAVLNHAARRDWCPAPHFERMRGARKRTEWLTPAEAAAQIEAAAAHLRPLLAFLYCTGARLGEAVVLQWEDVDLQHARATLRDTKNGLDRIVDLPPLAVAALAGLSHRDGEVFRHRRGHAYRPTSDDETAPRGGQIRKGWATALAKAGVAKRVTPHHARHSWASWHYAVHRDLLKLKDDGCWQSVSQVERYAKLVPPGLVPEILAFWGVPAKGIERAQREQLGAAG